VREIFKLHNGLLEVRDPQQKDDEISIFVIESQTRLSAKSAGEFTGEEIYTQLLKESQQSVFDICGQKALDLIYKTYKDFSMVLSYPTSTRKQVLIQMQNSVENILNEIMPNWEMFQKYVNWLANSGQLYINPDKVANEFVYNENLPNTEKETYTRQSYTELLAMSMVLRMLHPMWSSVMFAYRGKEGNTTATILSCLGSLESNPVVMDSPIHEKLTNYINFATRDYDHTKIENWQSTISSQDIIRFVMAKCLIDKAPKFDHRPSPNRDATLIASFYHTAIGASEARAGIVRVKINDDGPGPESSSQLEDYKTHTTMTAGARALLDVYMKDHWYNFLCKKLNKEIADKVASIRLVVLERLKEVHSGEPFERAHKLLASMFYHGYVSPNSFDQIQKNTTYEAFATILSCLIVLDMKEMACVFASKRTQTSAAVGKHSLDDNLASQLESYYPKAFQSQINKNSPGIQVVHDLYTALTGVVRITSIPKEILKDWNMNEVYISTNNLKDAVAKYQIFCLNPFNSQGTQIVAQSF
jgi:hypothetical protein